MLVNGCVLFKLRACHMPGNFLIMDDLHIQRKFPSLENVDYLSQSTISDYHLYVCWRQNNSVSVKSHLDDICLTIPSTVSRRLENISWRRWYKLLQGLDEVSPSAINWNKSQDITWLYGPKFSGECQFDQVSPGLTSRNLAKAAYEDVPDLDLDVISIELEAGSLNIDDVLLVESQDDDADDFKLKLALKPRNIRILAGTKKTKKRKLVKFSYIVNSREFVNGILFDYNFLDTLCL